MPAMEDSRVDRCSPKKNLARAALLVTALYGSSAWADWHSGLVSTLSSDYAGQTITFTLANWSRSNCTCNPTWATNMCLVGASRETFKMEFAMLYGAKLTDRAVSVNINETTCEVQSVSFAD